MTQKLKKIIIATFLIYIFTSGVCFAGIMQKPRSVNIVSTKYFQILYTQESLATARFIADNSDVLYEKAKEKCKNTYDIKIIVVISPDSDRLSAEYTDIPYNRIILYDAVAGQNEIYFDSLKEIFYHEVYKAVRLISSSDFLNKYGRIVLGDGMQPAAMVNMPSTFVEGAAIAEDLLGNTKGTGTKETKGTGILSDSENLQILSQAKLEGRFPTLFQVQAGIDIYHYENFSNIAAGAFLAFVQNKWGMEKYAEYWDLLGRLHWFKFDRGIFLKVYEISMDEAWKIFEETIPIPEITDNNGYPQELETFKKGYNAYEYCLLSKYGFVWYDKGKHEVDIYDSLSFAGGKRLLFLAEDIDCMSLSPDKRFLAVSYRKEGQRENFPKNITKIFDLKRRCFLKESFNLYSAGIINLADGSYAVVGNYAGNKYAQLQVIRSEELTYYGANFVTSTECVYTRDFSEGTVPFTPIQKGQGQFACLIKNGSNSYVFLADIAKQTETSFQISGFDENINIKNLRYQSVTGELKKFFNADFIYLFDFSLQNVPSFTRTGILTLSEDLTISTVYLMSQDMKGGVHSSLIAGSYLCYSSHGLDSDFIAEYPLDKLEMIEGEATELTEKFPDATSVTQASMDKYFEEGAIQKYKSLDYMQEVGQSWFYPLQNISGRDGVEKWPGLGIVYNVQSDPFDNNQLLLSFSLGFLPSDYKMIFKPTGETTHIFNDGRLNMDKNFTFAGWWLNTSLPVDLTAGGIFKFNPQGKYELKGIVGADYYFPLQMQFRKLKTSLNVEMNFSTTYYDSHQVEQYPDLLNWPMLFDSYKTFHADAVFDYTSFYQYGNSSFENLGLNLGTEISAVWDINLMALQHKLKQEEKKNKGDRDNSENDGNHTKFTQAVYNQMWNLEYAPTQINIGLYGSVQLPWMIPITNFDGWIVNMPFSISGEIFYTNGVALDAKGRVLLVGKEIKNGFAPVKMYFPRVGLYAGYDIQFVYDTNLVVLPDLRDFTRFYDVFSSTTMDDKIFADIEFCIKPVLGQYSNFELNNVFEFACHLRTREFEFSYGLKLKK